MKTRCGRGPNRTWIPGEPQFAVKAVRILHFSIVQRRVLTPNDFWSLAEVEARLLRPSTTL